MIDIEGKSSELIEFGRSLGTCLNSRLWLKAQNNVHNDARHTTREENIGFKEKKQTQGVC
jgi:hypothetical protein